MRHAINIMNGTGILETILVADEQDAMVKGTAAIVRQLEAGDDTAYWDWTD